MLPLKLADLYFISLPVNHHFFLNLVTELIWSSALLGERGIHPGQVYKPSQDGRTDAHTHTHTPLTYTTTLKGILESLIPNVCVCSLTGRKISGEPDKSHEISHEINK